MNYEFAEAFFFADIHHCQQNESSKYSIKTSGLHSSFIIPGLICNCRFVFCHFEAKKGWLRNYSHSSSSCSQQQDFFIVCAFLFNQILVNVFTCKFLLEWHLCVYCLAPSRCLWVVTCGLFCVKIAWYSVFIT